MFNEACLKNKSATSGTLSQWLCQPRAPKLPEISLFNEYFGAIGWGTLLKRQTKLEGYISDAGAETFTVTNRKTGVAAEVAYPQVKSVQGNNLSTGAKIAIGVGIAATIIFIILWFTTGPGSD